jgi:hypothetical protein
MSHLFEYKCRMNLKTIVVTGPPGHRGVASEIGKAAAPVTSNSIREWFREADLSPISVRQEVPPRVRVETRQSEKSVMFDTCDHGFNDAVLHRNLVTQ